MDSFSYKLGRAGFFFFCFLLLFFVCLFFSYLFGARVSLCNSGWLRTHYVEQADLELTEFQLTTQRVLGLKV